MYWGGFLLQRFGAQNLMVMGMAAYAFRVVVYTLLDENHAWYILLVEPLHGKVFVDYNTCIVFKPIMFLSRSLTESLFSFLEKV